MTDFLADAPRNRTIAARHRDGYELRVKWDKRSGPTHDSYMGNREPSMLEGWCTREDERRIIPARDLIGWREIEDGED